MYISSLLSSGHLSYVIMTTELLVSIMHRKLCCSVLIKIDHSFCSLCPSVPPASGTLTSSAHERCSCFSWISSNTVTTRTTRQVLERVGNDATVCKHVCACCCTESENILKCGIDCELFSLLLLFCPLSQFSDSHYRASLIDSLADYTTPKVSVLQTQE